MHAFIIRPFGVKRDVDFDAVERHLIAPALSRLNVTGRTTGETARALFHLLLTADLVVADISVLRTSRRSYVSHADVRGRRRMMAVGFEPGDPARITRPRQLFEFDPHELVGFSCIPVRCYDVAADGDQFYAMQVMTPPVQPVVTHVNLVQHWFEELKAKVPAR